MGRGTFAVASQVSDPMKAHTLRGRSKAANDNLSPLKRALLEWSERDHGVRGNAKSFLRLLASHADEEATVWILRRHFARIMGVSVRSITTFTSQLKSEGLMIKTGVDISGPCAVFDVYRLAPANTWIQSLTASGPLPDGDGEGCSSGSECGNSFAAYREDPTDLHFKHRAEATDHVLSTDTLSAVGPIPAGIRQAFAAVLSPEQMFSYIDSGSWNGANMALATRTGQGAVWLEANDRGVARSLGIKVIAQAKAVRHG